VRDDSSALPVNQQIDQNLDSFPEAIKRCHSVLSLASNHSVVLGLTASARKKQKSHHDLLSHQSALRSGTTPEVPSIDMTSGSDGLEESYEPMVEPNHRTGVSETQLHTSDPSPLAPPSTDDVSMYDIGSLGKGRCDEHDPVPSLMNPFSDSGSTFDPDPSTATTISETSSVFNMPRNWASVDDLVRAVRQFDIHRPVESFSTEEVKNMADAADYLSALQLGVEAATLYIVLVKCYRIRQSQDWAIWPLAKAIIQLAHVPVPNEAHKQIAKRLILEELGNTSSMLLEFLYRMALANLATYIDNPKGAVEHLEAARNCMETEDILSLLPAESRVLDMFAYVSVLRCEALPARLLTAEDADKSFQGGFEDLLGDLDLPTLETAPRPFESSGNDLSIACIRSCIQWCWNELETIQSIPGVWKSKDVRKLPEHLRTRSERMAVFSCLWDRKRNPEKKSNDESLSLWISQSQAHLGVSSTSLLYFACRYNSFVGSEMTWKLSKSTSNVLSNFRKQLKILQNASNLELAVVFMLYHGNLTTFSLAARKDLNVYRTMARRHLLGLIRLRLKMYLPAPQPTDDGHDGTDDTTAGQVPAAVLPTLAAAFDSNSFRHFRQMKAQARSKASSVHTSISHLSRAFSHSLKLSDGQRSIAAVSIRSEAESTDSEGSINQMIPYI
jgi:hypothetical protein